MRSIACTGPGALRNARQPFAPEPGIDISAMAVQILSAPRRPAPSPVSPKRRSPPKPFWLPDSVRSAPRLVTKKLKRGIAPPAPVVPAVAPPRPPLAPPRPPLPAVAPPRPPLPAVAPPRPPVAPLPALPVVPAAPVVPALPVVPAVPVVPALPVVPATPVVPAAPVVPAMPVVPACTRRPGRAGRPRGAGRTAAFGAAATEDRKRRGASRDGEDQTETPKSHSVEHALAVA